MKEPEMIKPRFFELAKRFLPKDRLTRSVTILAGGTAVGQAILVLGSPVLTRLYTPDDFGLLAVFVSALNIVAAIGSLRYERPIPLPEDDETAANLLGLSLSVVVGVMALSGLLVWALGDRIAIWANVPTLRSYLWLLPLAGLAAGVYAVFTSWAVRRKAFHRVAGTRVSQNLGRFLIQAVSGFLQRGPMGLLLGQVVGQVIGGVSLAAMAWHNDSAVFREAVSLQRMRWAAKRYRRFPLFTFWAGLINTLSTQIPVLMLSYFFGSTITGLYAFGSRVLQLPTQIIGNAVAQVFLPTAAEANREGHLSSVTGALFRKLVQIGLPVIILLGVAAPALFALVFGSEWRQAGVYVQWQVPWLFFVFVASPLGSLVSVLEKQVGGLIFQVGLFTGRAIALLVGGWVEDATLTIALFSLISAVCWFGFMLWNMKLSGNKARWVLRTILKEVVVSLPFISPVLAVRIIFDSDLYVVIGSLFSGVCIAYRIVRLLRREAIM